MRRIFIGTLVFCCLCLQAGTAKASDPSKRIRKIGQSLFELQQSYLELKEDYENQKKQWKAQQEKFNLLITTLLTENNTTTKLIQSLRSQVEILEEQLESSQGLKLRKEIDDLNKLLNSIILVELQNELPAEKLILDIINNAESKISRDLLILYLAKQKQRVGDLEQSAGYYSTLVTEFPESPYVYRSIFEMSEIFGQWGKITEQITLLTQLSYENDQDLYVQKAKQKLDKIKSHEIGLSNKDQIQLETAEENVLSKRDVTSDIAHNERDSTTDTVPLELDSTTDTVPLELDSILETVQLEQDSTPDTIQTELDSTADILQSAVPKPGISKAILNESAKKDVTSDSSILAENLFPKQITESEDTTGDYIKFDPVRDVSADTLNNTVDESLILSDASADGIPTYISLDASADIDSVSKTKTNKRSLMLNSDASTDVSEPENKGSTIPTDKTANNIEIPVEKEASIDTTSDGEMVDAVVKTIGDADVSADTVQTIEKEEPYVNLNFPMATDVSSDSEKQTGKILPMSKSATNNISAVHTEITNDTDVSSDILEIENVEPIVLDVEMQQEATAVTGTDASTDTFDENEPKEEDFVIIEKIDASADTAKDNTTQIK